MPDRPHVVAVCGSLRDDSYTRKALRIALDEAENRGASVDLIDLRELDLPVFDADDDDAGDAPELRERVGRADSVVLGTPVYHGSYSSALKTALDYCGFDEFEHATVGLLCVAGGSFPITSLDHLRSVARSLNAWVVPHQVALPKVRTKFDGSDLREEGDAERVRTLGQRVVEYADIEPDPPCPESVENVGASD
ncbi:NADPH-dependent FMN reductase [Halosimplex pelagicum]|uniref:NAD(P)H-dependent oxidoreductase n=1 Tax=Halosimplex pelagicum TaxID=869886 RepID=A0A7D5TW03_9EURY|nr:NAD(P)H-dependent oxidoreductase [Halosimplex pelagicum]QLH84412.1 NAD(P)H-dependent oxidoreductase [Halosimplex pelagicum]